jgi:hypothetical protein
MKTKRLKRKLKAQPGGSLKPVGSERLILAMDKLMEIVEGLRYRRWSDDGQRLTDTPEWCELYCAWCELKRKTPPNHH